jgi:hypothetical protein
MPAARVTCPGCGQALVIAENGPSRVSCPRCLAELVNPAAPYSGAARPVIPLDRQAERDTRWAKILIVGLIAVLFIALFVTYSARDMAGFRVTLLAALGLTALLLLTGGFRRGAPRDNVVPAGGLAVPPSLPSQLPASARQPVVVEYGALPRGTRRATAGAFAGGFFSALAVCGLGILVLSATVDVSSQNSGRNNNALFLVGVVVMVVSFIVASVRFAGRWRGFGPGAAVGLVLGLMALGPCAACYLMTLK